VALDRKKLLDLLVSGLAACLVLFGLGLKVIAFSKGQWINAGGAILFYVLMFSLFVFRRNSQESLAHPVHFLFAMGGTLLPLALQIQPTTIPVMKWIALPLELAGILISIVALAALGRGFGVIAANRQVKTHGLYRFIRHPLYTGEALWFFALVLLNLSVANGLLFMAQTACQIKRIQDEEGLLSHDPAYAAYLAQVCYRMIPGIF
jgi:protein-S-isoprenylcysteine O-methyltransferase Ste14